MRLCCNSIPPDLESVPNLKVFHVQMNANTASIQELFLPIRLGMIGSDHLEFYSIQIKKCFSKFIDEYGVSIKDGTFGVVV